MTASKLSSDNSLMKEELDDLREKLLEKREMVASLEARLQLPAATLSEGNTSQATSATQERVCEAGNEDGLIATNVRRLSLAG